MLNKKIILGVTASISAYKAAELIRLLKKRGADVQVVMTKSAKEFISALTLQALSGKPVLENMWEPTEGNGMEHINQSRKSDLILVAPASANFIAKLAQGLADDLLSNICLARDCPILIAPSMNKNMWESAATQRNISLITQDGVNISGPENGEQACGEEGIGRFINEKMLLLDINKSLNLPIFKNKNILISCGATFEKIDDARAITNLSSGKMGLNIVNEAYALGANVTLIYGRTEKLPPSGINCIYAPNHLLMNKYVKENAKKNDIFISVAAISDYVPKSISGKLKKDNNSLILELQKSSDILLETASEFNNLFCVGFSAESENIIKNAQAKLENKHLDMIIANSINESMGQNSAEIYIIDKNEVIHVPKKNKEGLASNIMQHIYKLENKKGSAHEHIN
ncbi:bifunctional phosphopantothenoylcysteine decarboxylase/phosphopantothenate--cysteine ligase CoaBC [Methylophilaceae bacterium]|jgi:phosphopantothenoylcysteine decarboxylase / phosphopantothenate---cysteine ligase|nr:bifunctional phosphopantothenoylcysteine decarboxylase/phosphopantothenate--cysteine ligase CoaBC [Methylophilaceae bacterium]